MVKFKLPCVKYVSRDLCKCDLFKKELDLFYILDRSILNICVGYSVVFCFSAKCRNLVMNCSLNAYVFMHYLHAELEIANFVQNCQFVLIPVLWTRLAPLPYWNV